MALFTYDENHMGHITLFHPDGSTQYLQVDTDIEAFNAELKAIDLQWTWVGRLKPLDGISSQEEEESQMIERWFGE
jgi:hypothetical protein